MKRLATVAVLPILMSFAQGPPSSRVREYPAKTIREEQTISINGRAEVWQLRWNKAARPACEPSITSLTCPCSGFAYGEVGDLSLIRLRDGREVDQLRLTPFFDTEFGGAIVQRWEPDHERDFNDAERDDFAERVSRRRSVQVMNFADYDHDGRSTEFFLQTGTAPCAKIAGVVIGLSRGNARLHVFGTVAKPDTPLEMMKKEWDALRDASGPFEILNWACGDHGSEIEEMLLLRWTGAGIDGSRREYTCPAGGEQRRLIREEPL